MASGVESMKRRLLVCKEKGNEMHVVCYVWKSNEGQTNSWIINGKIKKGK